MPIKPVIVQRRMMELGRIRTGGEKSASKPGKKLDTFRFTSASEALLRAAAAKYGGEVEPWTGAPDEGYFQLYSEARTLDIILPPVFSDADGTPTAPYSQWFELWSGGGCQRRCDGETESLSGGACMCDPDERECKVTTRVSVMLPEIPGLGVWRLESHGYNAAVELPGTLEVLQLAASERTFIPAVLRIENRTKKVEGQTHRFNVPVLDLPDVTIGQLAGRTMLALNAPAPTPTERPALPAAPPPPAQDFDHDEPPMGEPPVIEQPAAETPAPAVDVVPLTKPEFDKRAAAAFIPPPRIGALGKQMFPGKSLAKLTDQQRGELLAALMAEAEAVPT